MKNQKTKTRVFRKILSRFFVISISVSTLFSLVGVSLVLAADPTSYQLLAPLPKFGATYTPGQFGDYVKKIIDLSIVVAAVLAVLMIVIGGFKYMGSESMGVKDEGKKQMQNAVFGLLILSASFLILNTINPELLKFNLTIEGINTPPAPTTSAQPAAEFGINILPVASQQTIAAQNNETVLFVRRLPTESKLYDAALQRLKQDCAEKGGTVRLYGSGQIATQGCHKAK